MESCNRVPVSLSAFRLRGAAFCVAVFGAAMAVSLAAGVAVAQVPAASGGPGKTGAAAQPQGSAAQAAKPTTPARAQRRPSGGGPHEGIKVHGHWMIEVRSPDGMLLSHTEFENALVQPYGAEQLAYLLLGSTVPGGYAISLTDLSGDRGPCPAMQSYTGCYLIGSLISPEPAAFGDNAGCGGTGAANQITAAGPCFPLSISALSGATGLVFSGTAVASTADSINQVLLAPIICPSGRTVTNSSPGSGTASPNACASGQVLAQNTFPLTQANLPNSNTPSTPCGGTGQVSCAVNVPAAGDSINVSVTISFQ